MKIKKALAASSVLFGLVVCTSVPAYADNQVAPVSSPAPSASATSQPQEQEENPAKGTPVAPEPGVGSLSGDSYSSLTAAMVNYYAKSKGTTLAQFISSDPDQAATLLGLSTEALEGLPAEDTEAFNKALVSNGLALDTSNYYNLQAAQEDLTAKSNSLDAKVVAAGASYAQQMTSLRAGVLTNPTSPQLDTSIATSMPTEGLAFGLFLNDSLTSLANDFPDVFGAINSTGLGTQEAQSAWNQSMMNAMKNSQADFTSMMPSVCGGVFLSAMASGRTDGPIDASSNGCGSCLVAGLYSNNQMSTLFNPTNGSTSSSNTGGSLNPAGWQNLADWQQGTVAGQNDQLASALNQAIGKGSTASANTTCSSASSLVSSNAGSSLSKTLSFLNGN